jgi:hypothetical protein
MLLEKEPVAREMMVALRRKEHVRIIDWRWRIVVALWRLIPRGVWRHLRLADYSSNENEKKP